MMVRYIWLRDLSDGQFLFRYAISMTVGFIRLRDLNDRWFYSVTRSQ